MRRIVQCHPTRGSAPTGAVRLTALVLLGLLSFQLSRVYFAMPANGAICSLDVHTHDHSLASHHHDHDGDADAADGAHAALLELPLSSDDGRSYFRHCKDSLDDLGLTPPQPFGMPVAAFAPLTPASSITHPNPAIAAPDAFLPPPSQPPRSIA